MHIKTQAGFRRKKQPAKMVFTYKHTLKLRLDVYEAFLRRIFIPTIKYC